VTLCPFCIFSPCCLNQDTDALTTVPSDPISMASTTTTTPPPIQAPTAKEKKYDRQLRLWAASGQRALEESHVLLIIPDQGTQGSGSSVAGIETLKNLVLPGIGSFTIADSATVTEADLGINFFLEAKSLGNPRAKEWTRLLEELNPDVRGHVVTVVRHRAKGYLMAFSLLDAARTPSKPNTNPSQNLDHWLADTSVLEQYNLIILCEPLPSTSRQSICLYAQSQKNPSRSPTPIISLQSVGFYLTFSLQLPSDFPIVETHPDPDSTQDLRLLAPWPELSTHASSSIGPNITKLDDHDHGHIPYILLLLHYLDEWRKTSTNNRYPSTFKEKTAFRDLVRSGARTSNPEGGEENFDEAAAAVLKTITPPAIGSGCMEMLEAASQMKTDIRTPSFWLIAKAVKAFYERHRVLPLPGSLPDMKAKSADYVELQNIYKAKARRDVAEVTASVRALEKELGRRTPSVPDAEIEAFCKNASHVKVVRGTPLPDISGFNETGSKASARVIDMLESCENDAESLMPLWLALQLSRTGEVESTSEASSETPTPFAPSSLNSVLPRHPLLSAHLAEIARAAGGELHNISSIAGGMVAQEAIKVITRQYVPGDNTCVFDGVRGKVWVGRI
jgi:amyloid beta precursor protein binding protein 1